MVTESTKDSCHVYYGRSTDKKPMKYVGNGSQYYEIDTSKLYLFDEENQRWLLQKSNESC
jgi:hypothetical protein